MKKIKILSKFDNSILKRNIGVSFLNPASISSVFNSEVHNDINYYCDGILMVYLLRFLCGVDISRVSFDYTSIAGSVFDFSVVNSNKVYIVGATSVELNSFIDKIKLRHLGIEIVGYDNGYINDFDNVYTSILKSRAEILVVGLGAGKQEDFISNILDKGFNGIAFSCGGFIRQEATLSTRNYYPEIINKLNLRAFYRMYKEPHTIKRYLFLYPLNIFTLIYLKLTGKVEIEVN